MRELDACGIGFVADAHGRPDRGIITAALAYALYLAGLRTTNTSTAVTLTLVEPLAAASWGIFLLGEPMTVNSILGIVAILASTVLLSVLGDKGGEKKTSS